MLTAAVTLMIGAACGGASEAPDPETAPATSIPTATPFAVEPEPTIVGGVAPDIPGELTYIVEPGDTLSEIAIRFETTVQAIMEMNGLTDPTLIFVGQELLIAGGPEEEAGDNSEGTSSTGSDASTYVVQPGDTAWDIARSFDTTVEQLAEANGLTVDGLVELQPGDELTLPRPR